MCLSIESRLHVGQSGLDYRQDRDFPLHHHVHVGSGAHRLLFIGHQELFTKG